MIAVIQRVTITYVIRQPNEDELEYDTTEQLIDALQYYPQGSPYIKTVTLEEFNPLSPADVLPDSEGF